jgi:hypothetical protein
MEYELERLRNHFPDFALSAEHSRGRWHYLARSRHCGLNPWVVITSDLRELNAVLRSASPNLAVSSDDRDDKLARDPREAAAQ